MVRYYVATPLPLFSMSKNPKISNKPSWPIWIHWHPKGCMTLEVWLGIIIKSNPISYVLWHTRMVTCELCPPIMKRCLFSLDISYMLPMCTKKWITHHYMSPTKKWITCHQVFLCMAISPTYNFITWVHPYLFFNKLGVYNTHNTLNYAINNTNSSLCSQLKIDQMVDYHRNILIMVLLVLRQGWDKCKGICAFGITM